MTPEKIDFWNCIYEIYETENAPIDEVNLAQEKKKIFKIYCTHRTELNKYLRSKYPEEFI